MIYTFLLLSIIKLSLSLNDNSTNDFPPNEYFNKIKQESIYIGSKLVYLKFNSTVDQKDIDFYDLDNKTLYLNKRHKIIEDCEKKTGENCIKNKSISYGEIIFIKYEILSYFLLYFGFFISLYSTGYYIFGLIFQCTFFIYYIIKDFVELFEEFSNEVVPLFIFTGAFITGILIAFYFRRNNENDNIIRMIYGTITGYFLFKIIFYYTIIYFGLNSEIVFIIFMLLFIIMGLIVSFFMKDIYNQKFLIICNGLNGSFYIVKAIAYIVGGYYSDIIATKNDIEFEKDAKVKIVLYMFIQIFLFLGSFWFQTKYVKYIDNKNNIYYNLSSKSSLTGSGSNIRTAAISNKVDSSNDSGNISLNNNTITNINNNSSNNSKNSNTSEDDLTNNNIYDQEE